MQLTYYRTAEVCLENRAPCVCSVWGLLIRIPHTSVLVGKYLSQSLFVSAFFLNKIPHNVQKDMALAQVGIDLPSRKFAPGGGGITEIKADLGDFHSLRFSLFFTFIQVHFTSCTGKPKKQEAKPSYHLGQYEVNPFCFSVFYLCTCHSCGKGEKNSLLACAIFLLLPTPLLIHI